MALKRRGSSERADWASEGGSQLLMTDILVSALSDRPWDMRLEVEAESLKTSTCMS
jgi:hypothetical protein